MSERKREEANKKVARDYIERVFNQAQPDLAANFFTPDVVWHGGILGDIAGADNVTGMLRGFIGALSDLKAVEEDVIAEGDLVMLRLVVTATHQGNLLGVPASGRQILDRGRHLPDHRRPYQRGVGGRRRRRHHVSAWRLQPAVARLTLREPIAF